MDKPIANSPECLKCGGRYCKQRQTGADAKGRIIRERVCQECGNRFITMEHAVPGVKFSEVDVEKKAYQKLWKRRKYGWWGQKTYQRIRPKTISVDIRVWNPNERTRGTIPDGAMIFEDVELTERTA